MFVVDDDRDMRQYVRSLLEGIGYKTQLFDSASQFLEAVPRPQGVVILDLRMPGISGLALLRKWVLPRPGLEVVFLTGSAEIADAVDIMKAGVHDLLVKPFREQALIDAVYGAALKVRASLARAEESAAVAIDLATLSPAERQVAGYLASGLLSKQIAAITGRSESTIKVHRSRIMRKMRAVSFVGLVRKLSAAIRAEAETSA